MRAGEVRNALDVTQREELIREQQIDARYSLGAVVRTDAFFDIRAQRRSDPSVVPNEDANDTKSFIRRVDVFVLEAVGSLNAIWTVLPVLEANGCTSGELEVAILGV